jgi:hypothetical protein
MDASFRDIFTWLSLMDWPSLSVIWNWLMSVPWWFAILVVYASVKLTKLLLIGSVNLYIRAAEKAEECGKWLDYWWYRVSAIMRLVIGKSRLYVRKGIDTVRSMTTRA